MSDELESNSATSSEVDREVVRVLDAYLVEIEAGRAVDKGELLRAHPEIAGELQACLGVLDFAEGLSDLPARPAGLASIAEYDLLDEIARGGMGVVYKARHRRLNRIVALKMIGAGEQAHPAQRARFLIEAEAVARLHHPNIVQIYDFGDTDGRPFVVLELLEGGSLADRLKETTWPGRAAAELVATLASAMHAAHQAGIVHRDLKPSNVLFGSDGVPRIADFGLAKRLEVQEQQTQSGQVMGTPSYMAPEQAQGRVRQIGPPADIYALGATLYEMLTGRPPFPTPSTMETLHQVIYDDVMPPSKLRVRLARDLETICLKCLQKEPQKRYGTAQELAEDLRRYLDNRPIRARRTPLLERGMKWGRRHPAATTLVSLAAAALLAAAAVGLHWDARQKEALRDDARRVADLGARCDQELFQAQADLAEKRWPDARLTLTKVLTVLKSEPRLETLRNRTSGLLAQVEDRRRVESNLHAFFLRRNEAFFHETRFTGLDLPANLQATRAAARVALGLFAEAGPGDAWQLRALPSALTPQEKAEIREGCYELLLILAGAVAQALPGEDPKEQANRGLSILDQAARLRPEPTRAYHLRRAACLARAGDEPRAARALAAAEQLSPVTAHDFFLDGQEHYRRGDWLAALGQFDTVLRLRPDHFWAQCLAAICAIQTNQHGRAQVGLNVCLQREPEFVWLYLLRGFAAGQSAVQGRVAGKALQIADGSFERGAEKQFEAAEADYRTAQEVLEQRPNAELRYVLFVNRALMRFQRGRLDDAVSDFCQAIRLDGRHPHAYAGLAQVFQRQKKWDDAVEQYTRAIERKPGWAPLYRDRAAVQMERDDQGPAHRAAALNDLEEVIHHEVPGSAVLASDQTARGELLRSSHRFEEAIGACAAALDVLPDYDRAQRLRALVLLDLRRHEEAIRACDAALASGKPWADIHEIRGAARAARGDSASAIDDYSKALEVRPGQPRLLTLRGLAYLDADSPRLALGDFDAALQRDESNGEAHGGRGLALARLGEHRAAVAAAETSLRHDPASASASARRVYNAARIYALAASAAAVQKGEKVERTMALVEHYQERAVALVKRALERTPPERRAAFWQGQVGSDPVMGPLQRRLRGLRPARASLVPVTSANMADLETSR
jgi:tetratricopeptide (TPR) repeat protein/tRNA A-37 threonylcarbamoyl transferase component Bud32